MRFQSLPTSGNLEPDSKRRPLVRLIIGVSVVLMLSIAAVAGYAATYPQRMPASVGILIENLTGANPQPIHLLRPPDRPLSVLAQLGQQIFFDQNLSASGTQSCASCHSPEHAYGPSNGLSVQMGGPHMNLQGYRPPPSLAYLYRQLPFSIGPEAPEADTPVALTQLAADAQGVQRAQKNAGTAPVAPAVVPQGGLFWDGRVDTLMAQASGPMLNPVEMANPSEAEVTRKIAAAAYAGKFKSLFGDRILDQPDLLLAEAMSAVQRYQIEDQSFHAFTSKYDYWLEGRARLSHAELHGMQLFNDQNKANCAGCHLSAPSPDGLPPMFTDTQYEALAVPRNPDIVANKDPRYHDMGICGPFRDDLKAQTQYCGMFLTPTLRNVAKRQVFFHNGVYHNLEDVLNFYNLRSTQPDKIYPHDAAGHFQIYNDLPAQYAANVDVADAPFDRKLGETPAMTDAEIKDIIAFLKTLDDGYKPSAG